MSDHAVGLLLPLFVAVPLLSAGLLVVAGSRPRLHRAVLAAVLAGGTVGGGLLMARAADGSVAAAGVGGWPDGIAIAFAADMLTGLMVALTAGLTLVGAWFAYGSRVANSAHFAPFMLVLMAGVHGALLTADLFNLFVFIEVMLLPSYGLYVLSANRREPLRRVDGARMYVTLNLLTSTILVTGVGFVYALTGSVNMAVLAGAARGDVRVALAAGLVLFALSIKASMLPMHGWLARAYPSTSPAVTAIFAALHTKVAVYAMYRIYMVVYDGDPRLLGLILTLCLATLMVGAVASVGEHGARAVLSWQMVSGIGGIMVGLGLATQAGLSAGLFYLVHHMVVMACLLTATGAIEVRYGSGRLADLQGLAVREPLIAAAFFVGMLSLVGIPPFSGFAGKLALVLAGVAAGRTVTVVLVLVASLISLWALLRIWDAWFWGRPRAPHGHRERLDTAALPLVHGDGVMPAAGAPVHPAGRGSSTDSERAEAWASTETLDTPTGVLPVVVDPDEDHTASRIPLRLAGPAVLMAAATLALGLGAEGLWSVTDQAARGLADPTAYIEAVLGR
ncbi:monovalent cation/H+ antiporter subunit D family protein [Micrococcus sp. ACRRV]|uniref:monovalent cation/H+ antiporter subunit D family protein n=1 Tax=Micrococcus sp. ACRRV TaxID=2918203 RepID=UPI001EF165A1|nr:monovalent cation/H+ antiporter subunit D family protein [Micrococcus sp. ACRRV]MCG7421376.1 monovalent cation/H+ antiporter subunit D family protein [Micrococcus sp. ACRRV]